MSSGGVSRGSLTDEERLAAEILGEDKVIGYRDACRVWQRDLPETEPTMRYTDNMLVCAADHNRDGKDWRLFYCNGLSFRAQLVVMGDNRLDQFCFNRNYSWWRMSQHDEWACQSIEPGYRLLDFSCSFTDMNWQAQNDAITASGEQFARAEEQAVAEACFSNYLLKGRGLLHDRYHWGYLLPSHGCVVCVGIFDWSGLRVYSESDRNAYPRLGVVRVWKPDVTP